VATAHQFGSLRHLARRFFGALSPLGPPPADEAWALASLLPGERALWWRMSGADRRHAVGVARHAVALLSAGGPARREVVAAALLHDVGKVEAGLGTFARVAVTAGAIAVGRERLVAPPAPAPVRRYLAHDTIGAALLRDAGSDPLTAAWAGEHHLPPARWSVERSVAEALKTADGD
jgi:hypothetical protein